MLEKNLNVIYNKKYLVIVPAMSRELLEGFSYSFKNTVLMENSLDDTDFMISFINKNNFKKIIFVNYQVEYVNLMKYITGQHEYDFIFTESLAGLSDEFIYSVFKNTYDLYKNTPGAKLGVIDNGLYQSLKNKGENVTRIYLDIEAKNEIEDRYIENTIGLLNDENDSKHSFYNELSAIKLLNNSVANLQKFNKTTKKFLKTFKIKYKKYKTIDSFIDKSEINLYVNFTANNNLLFLKSMDFGIPCILGNCDILDDSKELKSMLVMESDDDINEIADRIKNIKTKREKVLKEYSKFRKAYSIKCKKSVEEFTGYSIEEKKSTDKEFLVSVVVPVYNTSKYLASSLDSIIDASIDSMEILVINDGSTDDSETIILEYVKKYPELIRYIKQENHGLGNVRNVGLREAKGKYIASIDSDDTINIDFFESALEYLENDVDIVICDWLTKAQESNYATAAIDYIFNTDEFNRYEGLLYTTIMPSTCNKIIKKELFDDLDIKYIEDKYEDLSTNPFILLKAETIKYINKTYYEYYIRSNSIMRTKPGVSMIDILKIVDQRMENYSKYVNVEIERLKYYTYAWRIEEYIINQLYTIDEEEISNFVKYINKNLKDIMLNIFNNELYIKTLETLSKENKKYIIERNKAIENESLEKFIKNNRKNNKYYKLTPPIMYYGDNQNG